MLNEPSRTEEIGRLVQTGRYHIDPVAVADAILRRCWAIHAVRERREQGSDGVNRPTGGDGAA